MKNKEDIFKKLISLERDIAPFGVSRIGLFGSYARGNPRPDSDIDLLVEFINTPGLLQLAELHLLLEKSMARRVDLATHDMLSANLKDKVLEEVVYYDKTT
ncbi:nucleotidyltransferase family protein [Terasakiella sp. A23]|uniref:nucleotidyltransferase family protein n=1 Tax=Terasakiella sp. FCG-A23 TaxID=3080561 RepID=UPI002955AD75|nr:nucleotidyltransferase family protein [Terasakiella sp. A23]MDV7340414.1 nucleotidyltransferase family protein [Terasakiella sp. A23]